MRHDPIRQADIERRLSNMARARRCGVLVAEFLVARSPAENCRPAGHPGFATDSAKAFALGKPGADRYGDLKAIIRGPAAPWVGHQSFRLTQRISRPFDAAPPSREGQSGRTGRQRLNPDL